MWRSIYSMHHQVHCSCWLALIDSVQRIGCGSPHLSVSDPSETKPLASLTRLESASRCMKCYERQHLTATASCNSLGELNAPSFLPCVTWVTRLHNWRYLARSDSSNLRNCQSVCIHVLTPTGRTEIGHDLENGQKMRSTLQFTWIFERASTSLGHFDTWKSHSMSWTNISSRENRRKSKISWKHRFGRPLSLTCFENCQNLSARCQVQSFANTLVFVYVFLGDGWVSLRLFLKLHYKMPNISGRVRVRFNFAVRPWGICQYLSWRTLESCPIYFCIDTK